MNLRHQPTTRYLTINREIDVVDTFSFEPKLEEIFTALPKINRFNGQTIRPYSVAAHSFMCKFVAENEYNISKPHLLLAILLHDASEAYVGDIVRPLKYTFHEELHHIERRIMDNIFINVVGFTDQQYVEINEVWFTSIVREIDSRMALSEIDQLQQHKKPPTINGHLPFLNLVLPNFNWQQEEALLKKTYYNLNTARIEGEGELQL